MIVRIANVQVAPERIDAIVRRYRETVRPIAACDEVGPGSLAQSNMCLTVSPIFSAGLLSKHPHVPSMTGGATSLQCAVYTST